MKSLIKTPYNIGYVWQKAHSPFGGVVPHRGETRSYFYTPGYYRGYVIEIYVNISN
jgi:hypothetical protein